MLLLFDHPICLFKHEYRDHRLEWMVRSGGIEGVIDGLARQNIRFTGEFH